MEEEGGRIGGNACAPFSRYAGAGMLGVTETREGERDFEPTEKDSCRAYSKRVKERESEEDGEMGGTKRAKGRNDRDLKGEREMATDRDKRGAWRERKKERERERERRLEQEGGSEGLPRLGSSRFSTPTQLSSSLLAFSLSSFSVRSNTARYGSVAPCSKDPLRDGSSLPRWYRQVPSVADSPTPPMSHGSSG